MVRMHTRHGKHTQFSFRFDERELAFYLNQLKREMPEQIAKILDALAEQARTSVYTLLIGKFMDSVEFEEYDPPRASIGEVVFDSLKHRLSATDEHETRLSVYSDPYPSGARGSRGGRIAQYLQEGVASYTGTNPKGFYFIHKGFPALDYMGRMNDYITRNFKQAATGALERNLRPGGVGAKSVF